LALTDSQSGQKWIYSTHHWKTDRIVGKRGEASCHLIVGVKFHVCCREEVVSTVNWEKIVWN